MRRSVQAWERVVLCEQEVREEGLGAKDWKRKEDGWQERLRFPRLLRLPFDLRWLGGGLLDCCRATQWE